MSQYYAILGFVLLYSYGYDGEVLAKFWCMLLYENLPRQLLLGSAPWLEDRPILIQRPLVSTAFSARRKSDLAPPEETAQAECVCTEGLKLELAERSVSDLPKVDYEYQNLALIADFNSDYYLWVFFDSKIIQ